MCAVLTAWPRVVLAVSGGVDSMVLLHAAAAVARERIGAVATFDHGTGAFASHAARLVAQTARSLGFPVVVGQARLAAGTEDAWRRARWAFLRDVAAEHAGAVATAHNRDDQVETVLMRILRDAAARGLAGLYAESPGIVRPLLDVDRASIVAYAERHAVQWLDDPSNASPRHRRNRVRHELLPALVAARPALAHELLDLARTAAQWRRDVDAFVDAHVPHRVVASPERGRALHVASAALHGYDPEALAVLWPAIAARGQVRLDRRGTARLVAFTMRVAAGAAVGAEIQLSGAIDVVASRGEIVIGPGVGRGRTRARRHGV